MLKNLKKYDSHFQWANNSTYLEQNTITLNTLVTKSWVFNWYYINCNLSIVIIR